MLGFWSLLKQAETWLVVRSLRAWTHAVTHQGLVSLVSLVFTGGFTGFYWCGSKVTIHGWVMMAIKS